MPPAAPPREQQRATKQDARYTMVGTPAEHCGICLHFVPPHGCRRIAGPVVSGGWCRFFVKSAKAA